VGAIRVEPPAAWEKSKERKLPTMNVSVIGLGRLGAPMAAVFAEKGHQVIGVDVDARTIEALNAGRAPVQEPRLQEFISRNRARLSATQDAEEAVAASDLTFIIVPTPSNPDGAFSLRYVLEAAQPIGRALARKSGFHVVVLSSTVMPGSTGGQLLPALERESGKTCGRDFGLCYGPEFIALGNVIHDMLHPDLVLIGASDPRSGEMLASFYEGICDRQAGVRLMNFVNAELTKLSVNTFVTTKISYANMLAEICEKLDGADADVVTDALGVDSRIGKKYLKGALGYGGPCFPRDNQAFAALGRREGVEATLAEATDAVNRRQTLRLTELVLEHLPEGGRAGVLGLAYKPDTPVVEQSPGLLLARELRARGVPVVVYDPEAMPLARPLLDGDVEYAESMQGCAGRADVLVIATPWAEFRGLELRHLNGSGGRVTLIDCWRLFPPGRFDSETNYLTLGTGGQAGARMPALVSATARGKSR
jgi:UDPglucose 6-dehydrogenase